MPFESQSSKQFIQITNNHTIATLSANSVKLKHFQKFEDTTDALAAATAFIEGKLCKSLKKTLKKLVDEDVTQQLAVADAKLGSAIKSKLAIQCVANGGVQELMRCIRSQSESLLAGLPKKEMTAMALGLAHSLSRYKLKFSPDKIDTMIVQAQCLLDDLDKELNNYLMRAREWYVLQTDAIRSYSEVGLLLWLLVVLSVFWVELSHDDRHTKVSRLSSDAPVCILSS